MKDEIYRRVAGQCLSRCELVRRGQWLIQRPVNNIQKYKHVFCSEIMITMANRTVWLVVCRDIEDGGVRCSR